MPDSRPRGGLTRRQKWVDMHYEAKHAAKLSSPDGQLPPSPALTTSNFPNKGQWSNENLPEILFYIIPPESRYAGKPVRYLEEKGARVTSDEGRPIRDFEILPRQISVDVEGWLVETWRRIDPRISYQDILDRMVADPHYGGVGLKKPSKNCLQNHCRRACRKVLNNWLEYGRRDEPHRTEVETIEQLSHHNIAHNTVLNRYDGSHDLLVRVRFERKHDDGIYRAVPFDVTEDNVFQTTFPLHYFLRHTLTPSTGMAMNREMMAAWELLLILQERAQVHGVHHWSRLKKRCLPISWFDRTKNKAEKNDTFDGGCPVCSWCEGRDETAAERQHQSAQMSRSADKWNVSSKRRRNSGDSARRRKRRAATPVKSEKHVPASPSAGYDQDHLLQPDARPTPHRLKFIESDEEDDGSYDEEVWLVYDDHVQAPTIKVGSPVSEPTGGTDIDSWMESRHRLFASDEFDLLEDSDDSYDHSNPNGSLPSYDANEVLVQEQNGPMSEDLYAGVWVEAAGDSFPSSSPFLSLPPPFDAFHRPRLTLIDQGAAAFEAREDFSEQLLNHAALDGELSFDSHPTTVALGSLLPTDSITGHSPFISHGLANSAVIHQLAGTHLSFHDPMGLQSFYPAYGELLFPQPFSPTDSSLIFSQIPTTSNCLWLPAEHNGEGTDNTHQVRNAMTDWNTIDVSDHFKRWDVATTLTESFAHQPDEGTVAPNQPRP